MDIGLCVKDPLGLYQKQHGQGPIWKLLEMKASRCICGSGIIGSTEGPWFWNLHVLLGPDTQQKHRSIDPLHVGNPGGAPEVKELPKPARAPLDSHGSEIKMPPSMGPP